MRTHSGTDTSTEPNNLPDPEYLAKAQALREQEGREPVVVLNGLGGAGLKFRLRGAQPTHPYCRTWYARW